MRSLANRTGEPRRVGWTFAVLIVGVTAFAMLQSLVVPALPTLQETLHTTSSGVAWVFTAYLLSASICTPILGRVGDLTGKKRTFVIALSALAVGSVLAALATSLGVMIVARLIQGAGGGVLPLAFGIIRDEFPAKRVAGAIGSLASITAVGAGLGIVLSGPIINLLNVHWLFWAPGIVVAGAAVAAHFVLPDVAARAPKGRISLLPAVLLSAALTAVLLALSWTTDYGWFSPQVLGLLIVGAVLALLWVRSEQRAAAPLIDMRMMRLPAVYRINLVALLIGMGMYGQFTFLPQLLQSPKSTGYGFGATITQSGLVMLPGAVVTFVIGQYCGRFIRSFGAKLIVVAGCAVGTVSMILFAVLHANLVEIEIAVLVNGLGFGIAFAAMSSLVVDSVPQSQTGVAAGMNANIRTIGGAFGVALMTSVVIGGTPAGQYPPESGYTAGFALLAVGTALATLAAIAVPATVRGREPELDHAELAIVAGGTLSGDEPE